MPAKNSSTIFQKVHEQPDLLNTLSPREFEQLVGELLAGFGWKIEQNINSSDAGGDFSAVSEVAPGLPVTWVIQCKFSPKARPIGVEELRSLYGAKIGAAVSNAMLVTNSRFTPGAKSFAESKGDLHLIDRDQLLTWLKTEELPVNS